MRISSEPFLKKKKERKNQEGKRPCNNNEDTTCADTQHEQMLKRCFIHQVPTMTRSHHSRAQQSGLLLFFFSRFLVIARVQLQYEAGETSEQPHLATRNKNKNNDDNINHDGNNNNKKKMRPPV